MRFEIKGKADVVSKEEIRSILHATAMVLEYHNINSDVLQDKITVRIKKWNEKDFGYCKNRHRIFPTRTQAL